MRTPPRNRPVGRRHGIFCPACNRNRAFHGGPCPPCLKLLPKALEQRRKAQYDTRVRSVAYGYSMLAANEARMQAILARLDAYQRPRPPQGDQETAHR